MTKKERARPELLQASRKKRIAADCGQDVSDLNKLLKMQRQMADAMKRWARWARRALLRGGLGALMGKGAPAGLTGMDPSKMDPAEMEKAARQYGHGGCRAWARAPCPPGLSGFWKRRK